MLKLVSVGVQCPCGLVLVTFDGFNRSGLAGSEAARDLPASHERRACANCGRILEAHLEALRLAVLPHVAIHRAAAPAVKGGR